MDFVEIKSLNPTQIQAYTAGAVTIGKRQYQNNLIITPEQIIENCLPEKFEDLTSQTLQQLLALKPEVVLIGTGSKQFFPSIALRDWFTTQHLGVEFMDTAAACRTFQILTSENRRVVAVLFL